MKKYIITVFGIFVLFFFMGAFMAAELDPFKWDSMGRMIYCLLSAVASWMICMYMKMEEDL